MELVLIDSLNARAKNNALQGALALAHRAGDLML